MKKQTIFDKLAHSMKWYLMQLFVILIVGGLAVNLIAYRLSAQGIYNTMEDKNVIASASENGVTAFIFETDDENYTFFLDRFRVEHEIHVFVRSFFLPRYRLTLVAPYADFQPSPNHYRVFGYHQHTGPARFNNFHANWQSHSITIYGTIADGLDIVITPDGIRIVGLWQAVLMAVSIALYIGGWFYRRRLARLEAEFKKYLIEP